MKLKNVLKVLDKYTEIEIDNELGETIFENENEVEVYELTDLLENGNAFEQELLDKKVVRVYFDFGRFVVEIKE